jgi:hypothetical protein
MHYIIRNALFVLNPVNIVKYFQNKETERRWENAKEKSLDPYIPNMYGYLCDKETFNAKFDRLMYEIRKRELEEDLNELPSRLLRLAGLVK